MRQGALDRNVDGKQILSFQVEFREIYTVRNGNQVIDISETLKTFTELHKREWPTVLHLNSSSIKT